MPIPELDRSAVIKAGINPLQTLKGPIFTESHQPAGGVVNIIERLTALPPSISSFGSVEHACHRMRRRTFIKSEEQSSLQINTPSSLPVVKEPKERIHHGSGRSRQRCSCGKRKDSDHQCPQSFMPRTFAIRESSQIAKG